MRERLWSGLALAMMVVGCGDLGLDPADLRWEESYQRVETGSYRPASGGLPIDVFFSQVDATVLANRNNPNNIAVACARCIDLAGRTLDVCVHEIDNRIIIDAIVRAARRGVRVRVVTEADYLDELGPRTFQREGIPVIADDRSALMHNKFFVVDGRAVWTGSFNFTENGAYKNDNNGVFIDDPAVAANFAEKFRWFWEERKFGGRPSRNHRIPYPIVELANGAVVETYFSTHDDPEERIEELIANARKSVKFLAFSFTADRIADHMIERSRRGVTIAGVFESRQNSKYSEFERLDGRPNVQVLLDGNRFNMHHKVIILDDRTVITGSFNFSGNAADNNDENIVIIHDPRIAEHFTHEFARVFGAATDVVAGLPRRGY